MIYREEELLTIVIKRKDTRSPHMFTIKDFEFVWGGFLHFTVLHLVFISLFRNLTLMKRKKWKFYLHRKRYVLIDKFWFGPCGLMFWASSIWSSNKTDFCTHQDCWSVNKALRFRHKGYVQGADLILSAWNLLESANMVLFLCVI